MENKGFRASMVTLRGEGLAGTCVPRPALRGQNLTEVPLGTYRSSSAPRSSWSQGSCCLRPRSSRPQRSGLGCSHLWVWQKERCSEQIQADSRRQGWGRPSLPCPPQGREGGTPAAPWSGCGVSLSSLLLWCPTCPLCSCHQELP